MLEAYGYEVFRSEVSAILRTSITTGAIDTLRTTRLLNGAAAEALIQHVPRSIRSKYGMFFSGTVLASAAAAHIADAVSTGAVIADPACGAGDLLLACLAYAPTQPEFDATLEDWGQRIYGVEIHPEVAAVARERIALFAAVRSGTFSNESLQHVAALERKLPGLRSADFMSDTRVVSAADCVVMNPPFGEVDAPEGCDWSSGKVQQAALFTESVLKAGKDNQELVAILPDVLRSGTRYARWRAMVASIADVLQVTVHGRFDSDADVDVFILHARKRQAEVQNPQRWGREANDSPPPVGCWRLGQRFDVSVGPVVPHRDKNLGAWRPFLDVAAAPKFSEIDTGNLRRKKRYNGRLHEPPFIVVRRTSSPSDKRRLVSTLVLGTESVAVENHLIILKPHSASVDCCRELLVALSSPCVDQWINDQTRCRHLTTAVLKDLPLKGLQ